MIAYYLSYVISGSGKVSERPRCHQYTGKVTFNGSEVWLYDKHDLPIRKRRLTLFDDSTQPPKLIREDYPLKSLRKLCKKGPLTLPQTYISERGDICSSDGEVLMQGPKHL